MRVTSRRSPRARPRLSASQTVVADPRTGARDRACARCQRGPPQGRRGRPTTRVPGGAMDEGPGRCERGPVHQRRRRRRPEARPRGERSRDQVELLRGRGAGWHDGGTDARRGGGGEGAEAARRGSAASGTRFSSSAAAHRRLVRAVSVVPNPSDRQRELRDCHEETEEPPDPPRETRSTPESAGEQVLRSAFENSSYRPRRFLSRRTDGARVADGAKHRACDTTNHRKNRPPSATPQPP